MVLRCPEKLADASLLQDEPFKSCFADCNGKNTLRKRGYAGRAPYLELVQNAMRTESHGLDAAILWLTRAFKLKTSEQATEPAMIDIFIEFFWHLHLGMEGEAESLLHKACKARRMDWRPHLWKSFSEDEVPTEPSRRKRHKQHQTEEDYSGDIEDNTNGTARTIPSPDTRNATLCTRSRWHASTTTYPRSETASKTKASGQETEGSGHPVTQSLSAPSMRSTTADSAKTTPHGGSKKGKKRKSKKHGASSPSATSAEEVSGEKRTTVTAPTEPFPSWSSESTLTPCSSEDESLILGEPTPQSASDPAVSQEFSHQQAPSSSAQAIDISSHTVLDTREPNTSLVPTVTREVLSAPGILSATAEVRSSKTKPVPRQPTRTMPRRPAAQREKLSEMIAKESRYKKLASRGRHDIDDLIRSSHAPDEQKADRQIEEAREEDVSGATPPETSIGQTRTNDAIPSADEPRAEAQDLNKSGVPAGRRRKTAKKPKITIQNDSPPAPTHSLNKSRLSAGQRRKTVKKPEILGVQDGSPSTQMAKRRRRNDGTASALSGGLAQAMMTAARPTTVDTALTQHVSTPEISAGKFLDVAENLAIDVPSMTAHENEKMASDERADPSRGSRLSKPECGRKRTRTHVEAMDGPLEHSPQEPANDTVPRLIIRLPSLTHRMAGCRKAASSAPAMSLSPVAFPPSVDFATVDTIIRDTAAASYENLTCTADLASDWEADRPDEHSSYESDYEDAVGPANNIKSAEVVGSNLREWECNALSQDVVDLTGDIYTGVPLALTKAPIITELPDPELLQPRAPLEKYPPIWAESRQEVCESFDWFRSYQGGVYFIKGQVKGYLLGGFSARRDLFHDDGKLIISHGGGKAESIHTHNGHLESLEASDQMEGDKSVRALLHTYRTKRPLVLLIDDKYKLFPFDLSSKGCTYAILGWYYIAHAWAERQSASNTTGRVVRYKFAFQWCDKQGQPWWAPTSLQSEPLMQFKIENETESPPASTSTFQVCHRCNKPSRTVYEQGWMCLRPGCQVFWTLKDGLDPPARLTYSKTFLEPLAFPEEPLEDLLPSLPGTELPEDGVTTTRHFCRGWHCRKCGRLSSRYKWENWECRSCGERHGQYGRLRTASEFRHQTTAKTFDRHWRHKSVIGPTYTLFPCGKSFGTHVAFKLPYERGHIHVLLSAPLSNKPADDILAKYQEEALTEDLRFRRWPMRAHKCRGTLLTNYFSQNTGEPYQYVGGSANTVPFDRAPKAVVQALDLIKTRMEEASLHIEAPFNEVLSAAYMEEQRMAFHSDSERGLGPVVASLSLGASAYMYFRLHARYVASETQDEHSNRDVLKLFLRHGDVVVMEGEGVQMFYEHTVVPLNFRIAATARYIGSDHH